MAQTGKPSKPKASTEKPEKPALKTPAQKAARKSNIPDEPPKVIRYCSFCGRSTSKLQILIAAPNDIFICDECVGASVRILLRESPIEWKSLLLQIIADPENKKTNSPEKKQKQPKTKKGEKS